jgi:hypothetical protein
VGCAAEIAHGYLVMAVLTWLKGFVVLVPVQELRPDPQSGEGRYVRSFLVAVAAAVSALLGDAMPQPPTNAISGSDCPRGTSGRSGRCLCEVVATSAVAASLQGERRSASAAKDPA